MSISLFCYSFVLCYVFTLFNSDKKTSSQNRFVYAIKKKQFIYFHITYVKNILKYVKLRCVNNITWYLTSNFMNNK